MVKRKLASCSKEEGGKRGKEDSSFDRISMLPDDLLVFILSHLTLKEATGTSILSRRWRCLWTFTRRLDFDGTASLMKFHSTHKLSSSLEGYTALLDEEMSNYVKWVNHVVALCNDSPLEVFKVCFYLRKAYEGCIYEWVKYAFARKVETLALILCRPGCHKIHEELCSFPYRILRMEQETCSIHFKQLKKLSLASVNVNGETLEFFLCNCPLLEDLSVSNSRELLTLRIVGPFPSLKRLELCNCTNLDLVEIRDVNLVCLKFTRGGDIEFLLHNAPMLVDVCVEVFTGMCLQVFLKQFVSILPQLEILDIQVHKLDFLSVPPVKMSNLKQLVVTHLKCYVYTLLPLAFLIHAAPCLENFVFEGRLSGVSCNEREILMLRKKMKYNKLKEVEFMGYRGVSCEEELVIHFLKSCVAPALRKIVIDPLKTYRLPDRRLCRESGYYIRRAIEVRDRASMKFADHVPEGLILGIWLNFPKDQLFCLLGPNGAGKTTAINCLTGITPVTSGDALIHGYSIRNSTGMSTIRKMIGVCPQFDVLWDALSGKEHLYLFASIKGLAPASIKSVVEKLLAEVKLTEAAKVRAGSYSGGMRRRLSVAIALIGEPKLVILDEPTTGMDPITRRHVWDVIEGAKKGRAIILTTHSMEEADILGDRIGIMAKGRLRCIGTSIRLKSRFGTGFIANISFVEDVSSSPDLGDTHSNAQHAAVKEFFKSHLDVLPKEESKSFLTFIIPHEKEKLLKKFFTELQEREKELGIADIQLGLTTLEEVFLNIAKQAELETAAAEGTFASLILNSGTSLQVPVGARFIGIPGTESAENPRGIMVQVYWQQDDSGALCISGYSQEMPIPPHVQLETTSNRNTSGRSRQVHGIVIDPSQITDSDFRS